MSALVADVLFEALANGLWRGTVLVIAAALLLRVVRKTAAAERYAVWLAVLAVVALAPAAELLVLVMRPVAPPNEINWSAAPIAETPFVAPMKPTAEPPQRWEALELSSSPFLWLWAFVSVALAVRLWRRCLMAGRLKRDAVLPADDLAVALEHWQRRVVSRRVGFTLVTGSLRSPAAVGWLEPAVLLPEDAHAKADGNDLEMLWRHEQAHVARRDDWTQLLSECLFALAWFHPAAHWVRRRLEKERELACDEAVVNSGVEPCRYAAALGRWAERAAMNDLPAGVMGLGRSRALIIRRIEMLLSPSRSLRRNGGRWAFAGSLSAALAASFALTVSGPLVIRAQDVEAPVEIEVAVEPVVEVEPVVVIPFGSVEPTRIDQPEVHIEVPAPVTPPRVRVAPVLVSQAAPPPPVPPLPPAPRAAAPAAAPAPPTPRAAAPAAAPAAAAAPPTPPVPPLPPAKLDRELRQNARAMAERSRRWRDEMRPQLEEIQREAQRIAEMVQSQMGPQRERLQAMAREMAEQHAKSIQPLAGEMAKLGAQFREATDEQRKELETRMEALAERMKAKEPEFRRLEEEMSKIEIDMRPFEEEMEKLQERLREKTRAFEESQRKFRESEDSVPRR